MKSSLNTARLVALINSASAVDPAATVEALQLVVLWDPNCIPGFSFPFDVAAATHAAAVKVTPLDVSEKGPMGAFLDHFLQITRERRPSAFLGKNENDLGNYDANTRDEIDYWYQFEGRDLLLAFAVQKLVAVIANSAGRASAK